MMTIELWRREVKAAFPSFRGGRRLTASLIAVFFVDYELTKRAPRACQLDKGGCAPL